jgi:hypothetical protein
MSGLPDRPNLDQLRRQARELLRAAADGEPRAVARLRAVSERVTLSAAQLAVVREYGCRSWPALTAEVARRRLAESGRPGDRWSFGGAAAIKTSAGELFPEALIAGPGDAVLHASLTPSGNGLPAAAEPHSLPAPGTPLARWVRRRTTRRARRRRADAAVTVLRTLGRHDEIAVADDKGVRYALRPEGMSGRHGRAEPVSVLLRLDPAPGRSAAWLELRGQAGPATRLLPSARRGIAIGPLAPAAGSPAERELWDRALSLIAVELGNDAGAREDILRQHCSAALARTAELRESGELGPSSRLAGQLAQLCAVLTGDHPAGGLPPSWAGMLHAARRADGPQHHLDVGAGLPPIDGVTVQIDSLFSFPGSWRLYLQAMPGWWSYSEDGHRKWSPVSVHAEDDRGGTYLSIFGGSTGHRDHEELTLEFLPRLDPAARALKVTCRGAQEEVSAELGL